MPNNLDLDAIKGRAEEQRCLGLTDSRNLIAEVERLRSNNEDADGTDYAHPSYWRGSDAAFAAMCEQLRKILDGEDDCKGKCQEPWDTLRRRVLELVRHQRGIDKVIAFAHELGWDGVNNSKILSVFLRQELSTAKRVGAAECAEILEAHAAQYTSDDETSMALSGMLIKIAAELRAEVGE